MTTALYTKLVIYLSLLYLNRRYDSSHLSVHAIQDLKLPGLESGTLLYLHMLSIPQYAVSEVKVSLKFLSLIRLTLQTFPSVTPTPLGKLTVLCERRKPPE